MPSHLDVPDPCVFTPIVLEKVWGGRRLERLGKPLPVAGAKYGESWEVADMPSTSASGAGGGAMRSVIASGPMAGQTLAEAMEASGDALLARSTRTRDGRFPLLVKFLDAGEHLSVQVHPSPEFAKRTPGAHLKTECWCVLDAEPGAELFIGLREGVTRAQFEAAARSGGSGVVDLLRRVPAVVGECHNLPSGTVHALGAGVLAAEVQTPSDTTFRLYDWGRAGRALHVEDAIASTLMEPPPAPVMLMPKKHGSGPLMKTAYFGLWMERLTPGQSLGAAHPGAVFMVLQGDMRFVGGREPFVARHGQSGLVPAQRRAGLMVESAGPGDALVLWARPL